MTNAHHVITGEGYMTTICQSLVQASLDQPIYKIHICGVAICCDKYNRATTNI